MQDAGIGLRRLSPRDTLAGDPGGSVVGISTHELPDGAICWCTQTQCDYQLRKSASTAADGLYVLAPAAGPGRWFQSQSFGNTTAFTRADFTPLVTPADAVTTLFSFALNAYQEATYDIAVVVQCRKADGSTASYRRAATFKSVGGVVSQVDTTEEPYSKADLALAACVATIDTSGGLVRVRVTGIAATSLTWTGGYESALTVF